MSRTALLVSLAVVLLPTRLPALELVRDVIPGPVGIVYAFQEFQGSLYFGSGGDIWKSDGTEAGTVRVLDVDTWEFDALGQVGGRIVFANHVGLLGIEVRATDGTAAVNEVLVPIDPSDPIAPLVGGWGSFGNVGRLVIGRFAEGWDRIYSTDGTAGGTDLLRELDFADVDCRQFDLYRVVCSIGELGAESSEAVVLHDETHITPFENSSIFSDYPALATFSPPASVSPLHFESVGAGSVVTRPWILFEVNLGTGSFTLHSTRSGEPTASAPLLTYSNAFADRPVFLGSLDGQAILSWHDATFGKEPRISQGTPESTTLLADIAAGPDHSYASRFMGRRLVFSADDQVHGRELWTTDGTTAGTFLLEDTDPGPNGSVTPILEVGPVVVLRACTAATGCEPWVTTGRLGQTHPLGDINPGPDDSLDTWASGEQPVVRVGDTVFLRLDDGVHGEEVWKISTQELECMAKWGTPTCQSLSLPVLPPLGLALLGALLAAAGLRTLHRAPLGADR